LTVGEGVLRERIRAGFKASIALILPCIPYPDKVRRKAVYE
jgi:hypothetical protein